MRKRSEIRLIGDGDESAYPLARGYESSQAHGFSQSRNFVALSILRFMGLGRVELPTSRLSGVRSNHLSYRPCNSLRCFTALYCPLLLPVAGGQLPKRGALRLLVWR
jgi:hypothetical protein